MYMDISILFLFGEIDTLFISFLSMAAYSSCPSTLDMEAACRKVKDWKQEVVSEPNKYIILHTARWKQMIYEGHRQNRPHCFIAS